jgi:hypothetical protein
MFSYIRQHSLSFHRGDGSDVLRSDAAVLGPRAWRLLHTIGAYYNLLTFAIAFGRRALRDPCYMPFAAAAALMLPIVKRLNRCNFKLTHYRSPVRVHTIMRDTSFTAVQSLRV